MSTLKTAAVIAILFVAGLALAPAPSTLLRAGFAAETPKAPADPAKGEAPAVPADIAAVLDKMDAVGKDLKTVSAKFDYELYQMPYDDKQNRKGELSYQAPNLLRFSFTDKPTETYIFDGRNLFQQKDAAKQLVIWQIRLPAEPPVPSLELGKTPFPLPFGQRKEEVLKQFTVTRDADEEKKDKDGRTVLVLAPKPNSPLARDYTKIILWIDAKSSLPTRVQLFDQSENRTTFDFTDIQTNKELDPKSFTRPDVPQNWEIVNHPKEK
jgi:outer membrane lipoprotein-sorting protein